MLVAACVLLQAASTAGPAERRAALVLGPQDYLTRGVPIAQRLASSDLFDEVYLLDQISRERLVAPWELYKASGARGSSGVLPAFAPNPGLADGVRIVRCDRRLACFEEVLQSRRWQLVVDLAFVQAPSADQAAEPLSMELAPHIGHYVLVSSAAVYGRCPGSGALGALAEGDVLGLRCAEETAVSSGEATGAYWRAVEAPLWADAAAPAPALAFTVLRVPDVLGETEGKGANGEAAYTKPVLQSFLHALAKPQDSRVARSGATRATLPGRTILPGDAQGEFSVAHDSDVAAAVASVATLLHGPDAASVVGEAFNIASDAPTTLEALMLEMKNLAGLKVSIKWTQRDSPFPTVPISFPLDTAKAVATLGIAPSSMSTWLPPMTDWLASADFSKFPPQEDELPVQVEKILVAFISDCESGKDLAPLAEFEEGYKDAARMLWTRFMYIAAPVGMIQTQWRNCLHAYERSLRAVVDRGPAASGGWLGGATAPEPESTGSPGALAPAGGNLTTLVSDAAEGWESQVFRVMLLSTDAADEDALNIASSTLLALSRTPTSWFWPPAVWGKASEMLITVGRLGDAAEVLHRALKFHSRPSVTQSWEMRLHDIASAQASMAAHAANPPSLPEGSEDSTVHTAAGVDVQPMLRLESPSMAEFAEKCAIPEIPVILLGEVQHWEAKDWRAEGNLRSTCPHAEATMVYAQPQVLLVLLLLILLSLCCCRSVVVLLLMFCRCQAALEFAGLAQSKRMHISEYLDDYIVDETLLSQGVRGASERMDTVDLPSENRTGLSNRSPYLWDLSLHDECPQVLPDIRVPKYFADDLLTLGVPIIGGDSMIVWPTMMLGGAGTGSACHQDRKATPFWLAMLVGKKRVVMYSHEDAHLLYPFGMQDQGSFTTFRFDPFEPDYERYPNAKAATRYEATVEPGEILWIPPLWVHCLVNVPEEEELAVERRGQVRLDSAACHRLLPAFGCRLSLSWLGHF